MKQAQNTTLLLLSVTAVILTTLLVVSLVSTESAVAAAGASRSGDYVMAAGSYDTESDFIYVLDIANEKLNIYYPNINTKSIDMGVGVDLAKVFGTARRP